MTRAIVANDMRPVEKEFNAITREKLRNHGTVGRLADDLAPLGTFKRAKENTPKDARPGLHTFVAEFEKGNWTEDLTLDTEGKIASFHIHAPQ